MSDPHRFTVTCARHLQPLLADELAQAGFGEVKETPAGATVHGSLEAAYRACLWSRTASRVLLELGAGDVADGDALYGLAGGVDWTAHLASGATFAVDATVSGASTAFRHPHYAALRVKDAVVDQLRERRGERPSVDTGQPDLRLHVLIRRGRAVISLDLAGDALHRRGYRLEQGAAPLRETLAAALLLRCGWPALAAAGGAFVDLMCGAGTLLVEAAWMAGDVAPGLTRRRWGFSAWPGHDAAGWEALLAEARARRAAGLARLPPVHGYDADGAVLRSALGNLARAGLADHVRVEQRDLRRGGYRLPPGGGLVMANPPYGERLGERADLEALYGALGARLRAEFVGWRAAVFTGNPPLGRALGLNAERIHKFMNGPIECRLLQFRIEAASAESAGGAAHTATGGAGDAAAAPVALGEAAQALANRLRKNARHLARWRRREAVECYRLYDRDLPEYRVAIDVYTAAGRVHAHVQEYAAPASVDAALADTRLTEAVAATRVVLEIERGQVHVKRRQRQRGSRQYQRLGQRGEFLEVREGPARLLVNLDDYLDTGLFLDHRPMRRRIHEQAAGRRFLNLFAYTGTVTVFAALGGAASTTTVDLSNTYLDWAARNLALNGIEIGGRHRLVRADVMAWLGEAAAGDERFDLIFVDPPSFSASKRMQATFDVQRDHVALLQACRALLVPDGELFFSCNLRRFTLDEAALAAGGLRAEDLTAASIPPDFDRRRGDVHHCWRLRAAP